MATSVIMPQLAESIVEGTIGTWLKKVGDRVEKEESLVEIVTDKVTTEIPSPAAGILQSIAALEGATVPVGQEIAVIAEAAAAQARPAAPIETRPQPPSEEAETGRRRYTPLVQRLAREHSVDLDALQGTGMGGRITRDDVLNCVAQRASAQAAPPSPAAPAPTTAAPPAPVEPGVARGLGPNEEAIPLTPIRKTVADRMARSKELIPHAWVVMEVDLTNLVRRREAIKEQFKEREGTELTYLPFVINATVEALKEFRIVNSRWGEDKIIVSKAINIGVAVATDAGLVVPVIHDADRKSIAGLARETNDLAARAREGRLTVPDVQGGTFTVNNVGAFGSILSMPIINYPQAGILNMEAIVKRPIVHDDAIAIRSMMNLCFSFDHRVLDGATAGHFLQSIRRRLEAYGPETPIF